MKNWACECTFSVRWYVSLVLVIRFIDFVDIWRYLCKIQKRNYHSACSVPAHRSLLAARLLYPQSVRFGCRKPEELDLISVSNATKIQYVCRNVPGPTDNTPETSGGFSQALNNFFSQYKRKMRPRVHSWIIENEHEPCTHLRTYPRHVPQWNCL